MVSRRGPRRVGTNRPDPGGPRFSSPRYVADTAHEHGALTHSPRMDGLYTTLVEGDDMNEPIGDAVRSILDGHVVLHRKLAQAGHFPSIEVLDSVSRVAPQIT